MCLYYTNSTQCQECIIQCTTTHSVKRVPSAVHKTAHSVMTVYCLPYRNSTQCHESILQYPVQHSARGQAIVHAVHSKAHGVMRIVVSGNFGTHSCSPCAAVQQRTTIQLYVVDSARAYSYV